MLEKWLEEYEELFNERYPLCVASGMTDEEIVNDIKECIKNCKKAEAPTYYEDEDY